jgi:hypothetical protein
MFPNWTGWKTVKLILAVLSAGSSALPAPYNVDVGTVLSAVLAVVVILSGTNAGPAMAAKTAKIATAVLLAFSLSTTTSCKPGNFPTIAQTIIADLEAGDSDSKIASDVCADLGGSSMTDAICADVTTVVTNIIKALILNGSLSGKALANGHAYTARHSQ